MKINLHIKQKSLCSMPKKNTTTIDVIYTINIKDKNLAHMSYGQLFLFANWSAYFIVVSKNAYSLALLWVQTCATGYVNTPVQWTVIRVTHHCLQIRVHCCNLFCTFRRFIVHWDAGANHRRIDKQVSKLLIFSQFTNLKPCYRLSRIIQSFSFVKIRLDPAICAASILTNDKKTIWLVLSVEH